MAAATIDEIHALPKAELHLHIEGGMPWDMVRARVRSWPSPPPWWATDYRFDSFGHFTEVIRQCYESTLTSIKDYHDAAEGVFRKLLAQNVRYVEISFSLGHVLFRNFPLAGVVGAIRQTAPPGLTVRVFCGVSRSRPLPTEDVMAAVLSVSGLDGLDLHGDETVQGPEPFADLFAQARRRGLATKAHAGELAGPNSLRNVIDTLQLTRVEHGVSAEGDESLMARLAAEAITLDMCPTSNIKLRVVESLAAHPIRRFHDRGIRVTVSTDNPTVLGCTLTDELQMLADDCDFTVRDLAQLQRNAFRVALMPAADRAAVFAEIDDVLASTGG